MPTHSRNPRRSPISALHLALCAWSLLPACSPKTPARHAPPDTHDPTPLLLDFEQPNPPVTWTPAPSALSTTTQPATPPALSRSALRPNTGLWSMKISLPSQSAGTLSHAFATPVDLHAADTLQLAAMHLGPPARSATVAAAVTLTDGSGTSVTGDFYPLFSKWQTIPLDLATAATPTGTAPPLDLSHIASIGMVLKPLPASTRAGAATTEPADEPLDIQTDSWAALPDRHTYVGDHQPNTFYAERRGSRLLVGMADAYELAFTDQSTFDQPDPAPTAHAPFLTISQGPNHRIVVGQPHTGLELLGPQSLEGLAMESGPATLPTAAAPSLGLPDYAQPSSTGFPESWPGSHSTIHFECTWSSPVAALIEGKQEVAPYDRLSRPAATLTWRFMIYQWGQVFVHVEWAADSDTIVPPPTSWALALDTTLLTPDGTLLNQSQEDFQRVLTALYPPPFLTAPPITLPHRMQPGAPVALLAKTLPPEPTAPSNWWWATVDNRRFFGNAIPALPPGTSSAIHQSLNAMLLVNSPPMLTQAGSFSQYLLPPRLRIRQGELDRNFPGDSDNDGFNDAYGFQVIRLANGRAAFTVYPDNRPLFYPAFLFTIPAIERAALDLDHSRLLVNVDGKQFADPPRFPDGSFLLQLPYILDRSVSIEAVLIKK